MSDFRRVSADNLIEARETMIVSAIPVDVNTYGITVNDVQDWNEECDFITYGRDDNGEISEASRVVWSGTKVNSTYINAVRVGGSQSAVPEVGHFISPVPTHYWANSLVDQLNKCLSSDGSVGIKDNAGNDVVFSIDSIEPSPKEGRTIIWFERL
jgi:hypothetical protein